MDLTFKKNNGYNSNCAASSHYRSESGYATESEPHE
jgi:hypothetical protein